jgi:pimeloyl-ACP methyl ester carboxylesterase
VPGSELVEVPKAAHLVPGDNPAGFSEAIDPFLNRLLES